MRSRTLDVWSQDVSFEHMFDLITIRYQSFQITLEFAIFINYIQDHFLFDLNAGNSFQNLIVIVNAKHIFVTEFHF